MTTQTTRSRHKRILVLAASVLALAVTGAEPAVAGNTAEASVPTRAEVLASLSPTTGQYVEAILSLTPAQLSASFGTGPAVTQKLNVKQGAPTRAEVLASLGPKVRRYVEAIMALTPTQLSASFGTGNVVVLKLSVKKAQTRADVLSSLTPKERQWVEMIMSMTPAQLKATWGL
jgi:hypothetical protein